jgi:O-antigen ligase
VTLDYARGRQRDVYSPQLPFLGAFVLSSCFTSLRVLGLEGLGKVWPIVILAVFMLVVAYGVRTLSQLRRLTALLIGLSLAVSAIAVHQGLQPPQCIEAPSAEEALVLSIGTPDGRACESVLDCRKGGFGGDYWCERVGLFNTVSVGRRVRWRGQLNDPNELSVFVGVVFPFIIGFATWKRSRLVTGLAVLGIVLGLVAIVFTQSRGGQLVVGTVFAIFFISRFGAKGIIAAAVVAAPVILLGGRSGEEADASVTGRTEVLAHGVSMLTRSPLFGIGIDQFSDAEGYTAHNAYLLAAVELGLVGFFCWTGLVWASVKIPLKVVTASPEGLDPEIRIMALSILVSLAGMGVGIFFLSFTFKQLLFVWLGLPGALYGIVRKRHPSFIVRIGWRDCLGIAAFDAVIITFLYVFTRLKA